jgi:hypothetical protein
MLNTINVICAFIMSKLLNYYNYYFGSCVNLLILQESEEAIVCSDQSGTAQCQLMCRNIN